jgi:hypothetical protein
LNNTNDKTIDLLKYFTADKFKKASSLVSLRKFMISASLPFNFLENKNFKEFLNEIGVVAPSSVEFKGQVLKINHYSSILIKQYVMNCEF